MNTAYVALGANLPFQDSPPWATIMSAARRMERFGQVTTISGLWRSPAWPKPDAPKYINGVLRLETSMAPHDLLNGLLDVETAFGRVRSARWASRTLDLDLISHGATVLPGDNGGAGALILPHPRAHERAFVLAPLRDVAPLWRHPLSGRYVAQLWDALPSQQRQQVQLLTKRMQFNQHP